MTRMTGPDCPVMCNLINIHTYTHVLAHDAGRSGAHTRAQTLFGYFVPDYNSFTLDSLLNLTISAPYKTYGCSNPGLLAGGDFLT